jgi:hypothetical protein
MPKNETPRYEHDCVGCIFLGRYGVNDLYYCASEPTLIARQSSEGSDYLSGLEFGLVASKEGRGGYPLAEAYDRAIKLELISEEHPVLSSGIWRNFGEVALRRIMGHLFVRFAKDRDPYYGDGLDTILDHLDKANADVAATYKTWSRNKMASRGLGEKV